MYMNSVCFQFKNKTGVFFLYICKNNSFIIVFFFMRVHTLLYCK